jgi:hypothetical protein
MLRQSDVALRALPDTQLRKSAPKARAKLVEPDREYLNQLFQTLGRWNRVLTTTPSLNL